MSSRDYPVPPWVYWKTVWKSEAIPKVKFFIWTLLKGKILTSYNFQKRGIVGPSRCPNCQEAEKTIQHLFNSCPFAISCWNGISPAGTTTWNPQHSIGEILNIAKRVWNSLPYALLWKIWLARNHKIFRDQETITRKLCSKAKILALETITAKKTKKNDISSLCVEERDYISSLIDNNRGIQIANTYSHHSNIPSHTWKIRVNQDEFSEWLRHSNSHSLFFDGASKSNSRVAGAGGVIYNPNGYLIASFEWVLGTLSNNRAEALALYQGLIQLQELGIRMRWCLEILLPLSSV